MSISPNTVKKYLHILESLYIIFIVKPYAKNIARSIKKEPKIYFFDTGMVTKDDSLRFENMTAVNLLKYCLYYEDTKGIKTSLHYLRTKEGSEVDFGIAVDDECRVLIEAKLSDMSISKALYNFSTRYNLPGIQLVLNAKRERKENSVEVRMAGEFFEKITGCLETYIST